MKKSLIALAVASAIPALAQAQTSVTLTGILKTGLDAVSVKNAGTTGNMLALTDGSSRFIIAGSEDLGGGLRATFQIDTRFRPDEGKSAAASLSAIADGATWVGLAGGFGQLRLGRMDQHYIYGVDEHSSRATPLTHWNVSLLSYINQTAIARGSRTDNLIRWDSRVMGGFSAGFGYSTAAISASGGGTYDGCASAPSLTTTSPSCGLGALAKGDSIAANLGYAAGPLRAGSSSSTERKVHSRLKTSGCGSPVSKSRETASQPRAAAEIASASSRRRANGLTVSAPVTVSRSLRPSWRSIRSRKNGSSRPPKRLRERLEPLAIALRRPLSTL